MERQKATIMKINEITGRIALLSAQLKHMNSKMQEVVKR